MQQHGAWAQTATGIGHRRQRTTQGLVARIARGGPTVGITDYVGRGLTHNDERRRRWWRSTPVTPARSCDTERYNQPLTMLGVASRITTDYRRPYSTPVPRYRRDRRYHAHRYGRGSINRIVLASRADLQGSTATYRISSRNVRFTQQTLHARKPRFHRG